MKHLYLALFILIIGAGSFETSRSAYAGRRDSTKSVASHALEANDGCQDSGGRISSSTVLKARFEGDESAEVRADVVGILSQRIGLLSGGACRIDVADDGSLSIEFGNNYQLPLETFSDAITLTGVVKLVGSGETDPDSGGFTCHWHRCLSTFTDASYVVLADNSDIVRSYPTHVSDGSLAVFFDLTSSAGDRINAFASDYPGGSIAVVVDGQILTSGILGDSFPTPTIGFPDLNLDNIFLIAAVSGSEPLPVVVELFTD